MNSAEEANEPVWHELKARCVTPRSRPISGIVLHDSAGTGTHLDTLYLADPTDGRNVSADFTVERDGGIWRLNPDLERLYCHHAGRATRWRDLENRQVNEATIGIEIIQKKILPPGPAYPDPQVRCAARLCAWLVQRGGLTPEDITTHQQIITDGSRSDPRQFPFIGENGFWSYFWQAFR